jgi:hypothetical protein
MSTDDAATDRLSTASAVAHAIRNGDLSARDVVERQLDRIARYNPALNAVVTLDADGARRRAREADRALALPRRDQYLVSVIDQAVGSSHSVAGSLACGLDRTAREVSRHAGRVDLSRLSKAGVHASAAERSYRRDVPARGESPSQHYLQPDWPSGGDGPDRIVVGRFADRCADRRQTMAGDGVVAGRETDFVGREWLSTRTRLLKTAECSEAAGRYDDGDQPRGIRGY